MGAKPLGSSPYFFILEIFNRTLLLVLFIFRPRPANWIRA